MTVDAGHILQPVAAAESAIIAADASSASPEQLEHALGSAADAVDASLRRLLQADEDAPEELRRAARSSGSLPAEQLLERLRERELISLELAGMAHSLLRAAQRAEQGAARPADAGLARRTVDRLREEVSALEGRRRETSATRSAGRAYGPVTTVHPVPPPGRRRRRRIAGVAAAVVLLAVAAVALVLHLRGPDLAGPMAAFQAGRLDEAEVGFRQAVEDEPDNVTARLYLARIERRRGNLDAAAAELTAAVRAAPDDADVRRELGYLFLDLDRPDQAADQLERAVELEPEQPMNWVGLVRALREADDPRADTVLRRAPSEVRALLQQNG